MTTVIVEEACVHCDCGLWPGRESGKISVKEEVDWTVCRSLCPRDMEEWEVE